MSPFSTVFRELRIFCELRQAEFASQLGYEQSYISAIELGTKGPPSVDFVERLVQRLELDEHWQKRLLNALDESQRKIILPNEVSDETYKMFNELRRQIGALHPAQVELIQMALRMPAMLACPPFKPLRVIKRKSESDTTEAV
ncbi:helix-turn-helix domain-containing protein [Rugamonas sp. DEMB1]|uniref:helix-turn-helix domain-containing protein n=1 Tax=Rugamonas sp. DEMB1 TaxID=3039386 RepID=UPI002448EA5C|nr:helix-turn-helix transcriptional regulator [Rugamonas sp. DEMB1]WGG50951.1 helix-turn-helix transcriptional regulator [Rugamonas sp. DEMB1]